jgi:hypothetical protein
MSQSEKQGWTLERISLWIERCRAHIGSLIQPVVVFLAGELKEEDALSRLCVVSLIELVGVLLTIGLIEYGPSFYGITHDPWQHDCLRIAIVLAIAGLGLLVASVVSFLQRWKPVIAEGIILLAFGGNIILFSLAMARTGGPAHSFFAQLVPMQLSGILILEEQKARMMSKKSSPRKRAWLYALFTVIVWVIAWQFPLRFAARLGWKQMTIETSLMTVETVKRFENFAATVLFTLGMLVTAFAYWYTPRLAANFRRKKRKRKQVA